ncbi:UDP-forming cellulose synthase catalytic subunit [Salinicola aestuarinus]|uniref:UDP-forming cellulose synthase catalytic subunit n=1 Tax=Salinicola aestuarinus TaxID=1949082 RepID=UPI000DA111B2|nr:UDP-forming cellulose synthase catalytic subunit [Salinicola aestuarinus]
MFNRSSRPASNADAQSASPKTDRKATSRLTAVITSVVVLVTLAIVTLTVTTPMSLTHQGMFGLITVVAMLVLLRLRARSKPIAIFLILLSAAISTRYLYWRATETLVFQSWLEAALGYGLFAAELYAWVILILGYVQNIWPLERKVVPMPADTRTWPSVDVYIPTYNESLQIVQDTVLAAQNLDYPSDKLNIYLLDDGRREAFAAFAAAAGVGYITRSDNQHAKAGNLNHAMTLTQGDLICIFDCDHVATRGFLQMTVGSFIADDNLALVQTPHHFYSPDPFERNLSVGHRMPTEDELFYGLIQKGNDYWNATFFCGSCAVIRRSALEAIGGFAVETVTEDAHTALKLQRLGWNTAFLGVPLAAGLATERLSLHVGQRMRWARGMTQILRLDNPLFGRGLSLMQRLCYLNAILHFQFALPRIVFLTAPLAYLLTGQNIIAASAGMIFVYALPHLAHTLALNSLLQGRYRFSFWAEIYETVLSFHLVKTTLTTLISPNRGKFNVTDKGGLLPEGFFDFRIVRPHLIVAGLLVVAIVWGAVRLVWNEPFGIERNVMLLNLFWASFSLLMLLAAIAVARESRQVRASVRVGAELPTVAYRTDGHADTAVTRNLSMGGALVELAAAVDGQPIEWIELDQGGQLTSYPVSEIHREGRQVRLRFGRLDVGQRRQLVHAVMGRADAWLPRRDQVDHPLRSLWWVVRSVFGLFFTSWQQRRSETSRDSHSSGSYWVAGRVLAVLALAAALLLTAHTALSQEGPLPQPTIDADGKLSFAPAATFEANRANATEADSRPGISGEQWESATLGQLTGGKNIVLSGARARAGVPFSLREDELATQATLMLQMRMSDSAAGARQRLNISLNGEPLRSLMLEHDPGERFTLELPIKPALLVTHNRLDFALAMQSDAQCLPPAASSQALTIERGSLLQLALRRLPLERDLRHFPLPFYSAIAISPAAAKIVLPEAPDETTLQAATLLASYLGSRAESRELGFRVSQGRIPDDDAIVLAPGDDAIAGLEPEQVAGNGIRLIAHPLNPAHTLMVVHGDSSAALLAAVQDLVVNQSRLSGSERETQPVELPSATASSAPNWISSTQPVELSSLSEGEELQSPGIAHPAIDINFRAAPDLFLWPGQTFPLTLQYTFPSADWLDESRSRLDVNLNGTYLGSLGVNQTGVLEHLWGKLGGDTRQEQGVIAIPPYLIYGENTLSLYFDLKSEEDVGCQASAVNASGGGAASDDDTIGGDSLSQISPDSTLDLSQARHFATLPNLSYFVGAGFPFTRRPDLAETALLLPAEPDTRELETLLNLAARLGESTGVAAYRVAVGLGERGLARYADRDLLVVAHTSSPLMKVLLDGSPSAQGEVGIDDGQLSVSHPGWSRRVRDWLQGQWRTDHDSLRRALVSRRHVDALVAFESPWEEERSVVILTSDQSEALPGLLDALDERRVSQAIRGDVALIDGDGSVTAFDISTRYQVGSMPWPQRWYWVFGERPWWLMWLMIVSLLLCTVMLYPLLKRRAAMRQATIPSPASGQSKDEVGP